MTIPKQIIQIWCQGTPPDDVQKAIDSWQEFNSDFNYLLFDDLKAEEFLLNNFDKEVLLAYQMCELPAMKSDLLRYALLYKYGGIYIDVDEQCLGKLEEWLDFEQSFICLEKENTKIIFNGFICSEKNHPILILTINKVVEKIFNRSGINVWGITGSGTFQPIVKQFLNYKPTEQGIKIIPFHKTYRKYTSSPNFSYKEDEHWSDIQKTKPIFKPFLEVDQPDLIFLPFVFTGHPRSGTTFITRLLQYYGVNVFHEKTYGSNGFVGWRIAPSIKRENENIYSCSLGKIPQKIYFQSLIQIVCDPHVTIPSIVLENEQNNRDNNSFKYRCNQIKKHFNINLAAIENPFECAAFSYFYWYKLILQKKPTYQLKVENADNLLPRIIADHQIPFYQFQVKNLKLSQVNSSKRKFKHDQPQLTESDVKLWSSELRKELTIICKRHNYLGFFLD